MRVGFYAAAFAAVAAASCTALLGDPYGITGGTGGGGGSSGEPVGSGGHGAATSGPGVGHSHSASTGATGASTPASSSSSGTGPTTGPGTGTGAGAGGSGPAVGSGGSGGSVGSGGSGPGGGPGAGGAGTGGSAPSCGSVPKLYTYDGSQCPTCLRDNCCAEALNCTNGTACFAVLSCESQCHFNSGAYDVACINACEAMANQAYLDFKACVSGPCAGPCSATTNGTCDSGILSGGKVCDNCLAYSCCGLFEAVGAEGAPGKTHLAACETDPTCAGDTTAAQAFNCEVANCGERQGCSFDICGSSLGIDSKSCAGCLGAGSATTGCCGSFTACRVDTTCYKCLTGQLTGAQCTSNAHYSAVVTCTANCGC